VTIKRLRQRRHRGGARTAGQRRSVGDFDPPTGVDGVYRRQRRSGARSAEATGVDARFRGSADHKRTLSLNAAVERDAPPAVHARGAGPDVALDVVEKLREHADAVSAVFVELFLDHVWRPFDAAGRPPERWPEVRETLERLRPLGGDALMAVFGLAMGDAVDRAFGEVLGQESVAS